MVYWQRFEASEWEIEYDAEKLASHGVTDWKRNRSFATDSWFGQTRSSTGLIATNLRDREKHFIAFVSYATSVEPNVPPTVYIVSSTQLRRFINEHGVARLSLARLDEEVHALDAWARIATLSAA